MTFEKFKEMVNIATANKTYVVMTAEEGAALVQELEGKVEYVQATTTVFTGGTPNVD